MDSAPKTVATTRQRMTEDSEKPLHFFPSVSEERRRENDFKKSVRLK